MKNFLTIEFWKYASRYIILGIVGFVAGKGWIPAGSANDIGAALLTIVLAALGGGAAATPKVVSVDGVATKREDMSASTKNDLSVLAQKAEYEKRSK